MDRVLGPLGLAGRMPAGRAVLPTAAGLAAAVLAVAFLATAPAARAQEVGPVRTPAGTDTGVATGAAGAIPSSAPAWSHPDSPGREADAGEVSLVGLLIRVGLGLSFVVGLAWGSVYLLRKSPLGRQLAPATPHVRVLERSFLAPKKAIYLVEIGDRALALGVTDQSITVLSRWRAGQLPAPGPQGSGGGFASQLRSLLKREEDR